MGATTLSMLSKTQICGWAASAALAAASAASVPARSVGAVFCSFKASAYTESGQELPSRSSAWWEALHRRWCAVCRQGPMALSSLWTFSSDLTVFSQVAHDTLAVLNVFVGQVVVFRLEQVQVDLESSQLPAMPMASSQLGTSFAILG